MSVDLIEFESVEALSTAEGKESKTEEPKQSRRGFRDGIADFETIDKDVVGCGRAGGRHNSGQGQGSSGIGGGIKADIIIAQAGGIRTAGESERAAPTSATPIGRTVDPGWIRIRAVIPSPDDDGISGRWHEPGDGNAQPGPWVRRKTSVGENKIAPHRGLRSATVVTPGPSIDSHGTNGGCRNGDRSIRAIP